MVFIQRLVDNSLDCNLQGFGIVRKGNKAEKESFREPPSK